jgi:hypothetical protein
MIPARELRRAVGPAVRCSDEFGVPLLGGTYS